MWIIGLEDGTRRAQISENQTMTTFTRRAQYNWEVADFPPFFVIHYMVFPISLARVFVSPGCLRVRRGNHTHAIYCKVHEMRIQ